MAHKTPVEFNHKPARLGCQGRGSSPVVGLRTPAPEAMARAHACLLYTSDAADDLLCVDLGGRRIIKKKKNNNNYYRKKKNPLLH